MLCERRAVRGQLGVVTRVRHIVAEMHALARIQAKFRGYYT